MVSVLYMEVSMYIKMIGLYGIDNQRAWFRKIGDRCFDFVSRKEYASDLTEAEADDVMRHSEWYCNQYGAEMRIRESAKKEV